MVRHDGYQIELGDGAFPPFSVSRPKKEITGRQRGLTGKLSSTLVRRSRKGVAVSKKTVRHEFRISAGQLYDIVLQALAECNHVVLAHKRPDGTITFKTGRTWRNWSGVEVDLLIESIDDNSAEIIVGVNMIAGTGSRRKPIMATGDAIDRAAEKLIEAIDQSIRKGKIPPARPLAPLSPGAWE